MPWNPIHDQHGSDLMGSQPQGPNGGECLGTRGLHRSPALPRGLSPDFSTRPEPVGLAWIASSKVLVSANSIRSCWSTKDNELTAPHPSRVPPPSSLSGGPSRHKTPAPACLGPVRLLYLGIHSTSSPGVQDESRCSEQGNTQAKEVPVFPDHGTSSSLVPASRPAVGKAEL
ncbi:hypothetical protein IAQ61_009480 [Plenodomus lingam]|uniref:uncharacterized protein n=1 Tax=Leptosphaeria maculans TaxID=5022 RepID=UPI003317EDA4|nr:hypothetical protein IAQ61_009480 [Plenodomus lingam]